MMVARVFLVIAALSGGLSMAAGAFASHALRATLSERALETFETGARYQMYHALALGLVTVLLLRMETSSTPLVIAGSAFILGMGLFSGSLYALSLSNLKWLGVMTPLGGAAFLVGWGCLMIAALSFK